MKTAKKETEKATLRKKGHESKMYKPNGFARTQKMGIETHDGEPIEHKVMRMISNSEPIEGGKEILFTERKEGVVAAYNIRTDRFDVAIDAMDIASKTIQAKRDARMATKDEKEDNEVEPTGGTE